jgi:hypothetical protein
MTVHGGATATVAAVALPPEGHFGQEDEDGMSLAREIAANANHLMTHVQSQDVSGAMVKALRAIGACPLRERGGFYLIPPARCEQWRSLSAELESVGVARIVIEMHDAPSNRQAATRAACASLESDLADLEKDLREAVEKEQGDGRKRPATLNLRIKRSRELASKAELFKHLLSDKAAQIAALADKHAACFGRVLDGDCSFLLPGAATARDSRGFATPEPEPSEPGIAASSGYNDEPVVAAAASGGDMWTL